MLPLPLRLVLELFGLFELDVRLGLGIRRRRRRRRRNGRVVVTVVAAAGAVVVFVSVEFCVLARTFE